MNLISQPFSLPKRPRADRQLTRSQYRAGRASLRQFWHDTRELPEDETPQHHHRFSWAYARAMCFADDSLANRAALARCYIDLDLSRRHGIAADRKPVGALPFPADGVAFVPVPLLSVAA